MKTIEKEIIDNSTNSPRLSALKEFVDTWLEKNYENDDDPGINLVMLGYDEKYKHSIKFSLTGKNNPQHDIFNAFNKGIGSLKDNLGRDIFNGMCSYLANVFVEYPKLYELFEDNIKRMKENRNKNE